jgi:bifunctional NMN adenylyltransferase/nudix hydrolase
MQVKGFAVGRFQPLHPGHKHLIRSARKQCDHLTIFVGSANSARTIKNPWTFLERKAAIQSFLDLEGITNVEIIPQNDYKYSDSQWINDITTYIEYKRGSDEVVIFGHMKEGNDYINLFANYKIVDIKSDIRVSATTVREHLMETNHPSIEECVLQDYAYFKAERINFDSYPYKDTLQFNTGDAVVECSGHILLIKRKRAPGAGTWALPGGHKNNDETFTNCVFRELKEETNLRVPEKILRGSVVSTKLFDSPTRGCGIPRNTYAIHVKIEPNKDGSLPEFRPADDAIDGKWVLISEILNNPEYAMFDDHQHMLMDMLGVQPLPAYKNSNYRK